jgi:hypothetical protein
MKKWFRRLAYFFIVIVWLALMSFPLFAFFLATSGEIMIGSLQESHLRLFLINSEGHQGLGLERSRRASGQDDCYLIEVKYLLWEGKEPGQNTDYCICNDSDAGFAAQPVSCANLSTPEGSSLPSSSEGSISRVREHI